MSDLGRWGFPLRDLSRRKFQTGLTILSLTICVAITVFLVLFAGNLGVEIASLAEGGLTVGFSAVFSRFIMIVVIFNSITGILVASFLITVSTKARMRDIGIMKAVGCLTGDVLNFFGTQLSVIVFASCLLGIIGGILLNLASAGLMNLLGFRIPLKPLNPWWIILIFFSFAFIFYIFGIRRIGKAVGVKPVSALSPPFTRKDARQPKLRLPFSLGRGFLARMAFRDLGRRRSMTLQSVACLSVIMALMTLAVVGGIVANETMQSYVERAVGRDIILIADAEVAERYEGLLRRFFEPSQKEEISYLDERHVIPETVISDLRKIEGVAKVDPRLILEATVSEYPGIIINREAPGQYVVIGDDRRGEALISGVHADKIVNDWLVMGKRLQEAGPDTVLIADSLALTLFQDPWRQSLKVFNSKFQIAGVCLDPLNNGMVVYVSFDRLSSVVKPAGYNLLLLQVDSSRASSRSALLQKIGDVISESGLTMLDLNEALGRHKAFLSYIWSLLLSLSMFSFVNAILSLMGYLMISISGQQRDLGILRALGAKPRAVLKLVMLETFLLVSSGVLIGLPVGITVVFWFFIPEAVVSQTATLSILGLLSILIGALCLSSLYPARKTARRPILEAISQT